MQGSGIYDLWGTPPVCEPPQEIIGQRRHPTKRLTETICKSSKEVQIPHRLLCPITEDLMEDPVVLVHTGQVYERSAIQQWLSQNNTDPITNVQLPSKQLVTVHILKSECEEFRTKLNSNLNDNNIDDDNDEPELDIKKISEIELAEKITQHKKFQVKQYKRILLEKDNDICSYGYTVQMGNVGKLCRNLAAVNQKLKKYCEINQLQDAQKILTRDLSKLIEIANALAEASNQQLLQDKISQQKEIKCLLKLQKTEYKQLKDLVCLMRSNLCNEELEVESSSLPSTSSEDNTSFQICSNQQNKQSDQNCSEQLQSRSVYGKFNRVFASATSKSKHLNPNIRTWGKFDTQHNTNLSESIDYSFLDNNFVFETEQIQVGEIQNLLTGGNTDSQREQRNFEAAQEETLDFNFVEEGNWRGSGGDDDDETLFMQPDSAEIGESTQFLGNQNFDQLQSSNQRSTNLRTLENIAVDSLQNDDEFLGNQNFDWLQSSNLRSNNLSTQENIGGTLLQDNDEVQQQYQFDFVHSESASEDGNTEFFWDNFNRVRNDSNINAGSVENIDESRFWDNFDTVFQNNVASNLERNRDNLRAWGEHSEEFRNTYSFGANEVSEKFDTNRIVSRMQSRIGECQRRNSNLHVQHAHNGGNIQRISVNNNLDQNSNQLGGNSQAQLVHNAGEQGVYINTDTLAQQLLEGEVCDVSVNLKEHFEIFVDRPLVISNLQVNADPWAPLRYFKIFCSNSVEIRNSKFENVGLFLDQNSSVCRLQIRDVQVQDAPWHGVVFQNCKNFQVQDTQIWACQRSGIFCQNSKGSIVSGSIIGCRKFGIWVDKESVVQYHDNYFAQNSSGSVFKDTNTYPNF